MTLLHVVLQRDAYCRSYTVDQFNLATFGRPEGFMFKNFHYSPAVNKSEADLIVCLYVTNNLILNRSELVIDIPCL